MTKINLSIDDLGSQGDGIAHIDDNDKKRAIFVPGALAGEKVVAEMATKNRAEIIEITETSPDRTEPSCPHFGTCGGCKLQHLSQKAYSDFKTAQLKQILEKAAIPLPDFAPTFITPPQSRRRARLAARHMKSGVVLGFNEMRSHRIVDIEHCALLNPTLMDIIPKIREHLPLWLPLNKTCDIQLTILETGIDMMLVGGGKLSLEVREKLGEFAQKLSLAKLSWRQNDRAQIEPIALTSPITVTFGTITLPYPSESFLQASPAGEKALIDFVRAHTDDNMKVLDLFCGLGTFGLSLNKPKQLMFADNDGPATEVLDLALKSTGRAEVEKRNLFKEPFSTAECNDYDCVIFDPPRAGAKAQCEELSYSDVPRILAISCNPQSFARDAMILIEGGYKLTALQPVDQFLWSTHMELAAVFEK